MVALGAPLPGTTYEGTRWSTPAYVEKVRTQFLSLRGEAHAENLTNTRMDAQSACVQDALRFLAAASEGQSKSAVSRCSLTAFHRPMMKRGQSAD